MALSSAAGCQTAAKMSAGTCISPNGQICDPEEARADQQQDPHKTASDDPSPMLQAQVEQNGVAYHRFWRGKRLKTLTHEAFATGVANRFIPATLVTGGGKGLIAYEPVLLPADHPPSLPDEVALVTYQDRGHYQRLRATPEGKRYAEAHWEYFDQGSSASVVPEPFLGEARFGSAYDLYPEFLRWQEGHNVFLLFRPGDKQSPDDWRKAAQSYLLAILSGNRGTGLQGLVAYLDAGGLYLYASWLTSPKEMRGPEGGAKSLEIPLGAEVPAQDKLAGGFGLNAHFSTLPAPAKR